MPTNDGIADVNRRLYDALKGPVEEALRELTGDGQPRTQRYAISVVSPKGAACFFDHVELLAHALDDLGYDVLVTEDCAPEGYRPIVIAPNLLPRLPELPPIAPDAILCQMEQAPSPQMTPAYLRLLRQHEVWDWSERNALEMEGRYGVISKVVPIGWHPLLARVPIVAEKDIDVFFSGAMSPHRTKILNGLRARGLKVVVVGTVFGAERDALIARAKVVLNVDYFADYHVFNSMRCIYAMGNGACVVSESGDPQGDASYRCGLVLAPHEHLVDACERLVHDEPRRRDLSTSAFETANQLRESAILERALGTPRQAPRWPVARATPPEPAPAAERPLLSLCMIVKNEAARIYETLVSARQHVDRWCILDTGSTDGTQEIVRRAMHGIPGELHEEPFVPFEDTGLIDFAATRNRCLDLECQGYTDGYGSLFTVMLSGDEVMRDGAALRQFCDEHRADPVGAYFAQVLTEGRRYLSVRIGRSAAGWRYVYPVHEVLMHPSSPEEGRGPCPAGFLIEHLPSQRTAAEQHAAMERDLTILRRLVVLEPESERFAFYLANTLEHLGQHQEAIEAYAQRVALGGWPEEVWEARYHMALCAAAAGFPWFHVLDEYLKAYACAPHRAEPLVRIAEHYHQTEQHALTHLFAARACTLAYPVQDRRLIEAQDYTLRRFDLLAASAWHLGHFEQGLVAAKLCAEASPDPRHVDNVRRYEARIAGGKEPA